MKRFIIVGLCVVAAATASVALADAADPLAELASLGNSVADSAQEGGGSIRAKREVDRTVIARQKDGKNIQARVDSVKQGKFPAAAIQVKVTTPAQEGPGQGVARNDVLVIIPKYAVDAGHIRLDDATAVINAGSYYLREGDRVSIRLVSKRDKIWEADYIERM